MEDFGVAGGINLKCFFFFSCAVKSYGLNLYKSETEENGRLLQTL